MRILLGTNVAQIIGNSMKKILVGSLCLLFRVHGFLLPALSIRFDLDSHRSAHCSAQFSVHCSTRFSLGAFSLNEACPVCIYVFPERVPSCDGAEQQGITFFPNFASVQSRACNETHFYQILWNSDPFRSMLLCLRRS